MTRTAKAALLVVACAALAGCPANQVRDVKVGFQYSGSAIGDLHAANGNVRLGPFDDQRGNANRRMIIHSLNGYGQPVSGGWQAEKPIAEIVRDAVRQGLQAAHLSLLDQGGELELTGEVVDYRMDILNDKFWTGVVDTSLQVRLKVRDSATRNLLWTGVIDVRHSERAHTIPPAESLFRNTLENLSERVQVDAGLIKALTNRDSP